MQRLLLWGLRRYLDGPAGSWVYTSLTLLGVRAIKSVVGRREVVDIGNVKPREKIVIELLPISHGAQIKQFKAEEKRAKKAAKLAKAESRRAAKAAKEAKRAAKAAHRRARAG